ncbi:RNA-directed DNA methylation 4-like [Silene latifolia]|uniref:RNA-directed DNA methylation 4-like n=1 Tax=Silene latifolia TaxID=37657 RepID=UPI003D76BB0A
MQHIETVGRSEDGIDFVNSYVEGSPEVDDDSKLTAINKQGRRTLLSHSELAKSARFKQIWKRRTHDNESVHDEALGEVCRVYDVVRVDMEPMEETSTTQEKQDEISEEDQEALSKFLPLLRECIPTAAKEIESDFSCQASKQGSIDEYVYDLYAVKEEVDEVEVSYPFPLVQLDDDDQYYEVLIIRTAKLMIQMASSVGYIHGG